MKTIEGNIVSLTDRKIFKGRIFFSEKIEKIEKIEADDTIVSNRYLLPGLIDAHVHIESSMLTPLEYSKVAVSHGVIAAVTDPHEIANVCGIEGVRYMINNAKLSPMKLFFGAPSCVPATPFESSGGVITSDDIEALFANAECWHLSEMMNFPGVIHEDEEVIAKLNSAKKYNKVVDGHAPLLTGYDLRKYVKAGIHTDHECTSVHEALEKISLGMKIMLRNSSASKDFQHLISLIKTHPEEVMLCTDDCHPDELEKGYINKLVKEAFEKGYNIFDVLTAATNTANELYKLNIGLLREGDKADFIVVDNLENFKIESTFIDGREVYNSESGVLFEGNNGSVINNFFVNEISEADLKVRKTGAEMKVIKIIPDSLLTKKLLVETSNHGDFVESDIQNDVLKIVVLNRYQKAKPSVGFIKGFNLKRGAIAGTIAHDSHNIVAVGANNSDILTAIKVIQQSQGGLVVVNGAETALLPLPLAGLMSDQNCNEVARKYQELSQVARNLGCELHAPFMTLAFMSLLVIPELKIGDRGLFDVNLFDFIDLQN